MECCTNPPQVFTPAQCYPMGHSRCSYGYGACFWQEWGGEPAKHESQGALSLSHPGMCSKHRGRRGLHPVLYQWYDSIISHTTIEGGPICACTAKKHKSIDLGPSKAKCVVSGYRLNEIRKCWFCRLGLYGIDSLILHAKKHHCCRCLP